MANRIRLGWLGYVRNRKNIFLSQVFMVIFRRFEAKHLILSHFFARVGGTPTFGPRVGVLPKSPWNQKSSKVFTVVILSDAMVYFLFTAPINT